jgi:hypothetical protein
MLRSFCLALLAFTPGAASAALIRGNVVENQSGKPLARAVVTLTPVQGTAGGAQSARTNGYGTFSFESLAGGGYVIRVSKLGFMPMEYGQKQWNSAGRPVFVTSDASESVTIRLPRYGAVSGTIVDENDVGLPQHGVLAYRDTRPPQLAGRAIADDRGVFRISGLEPGAYLVRTAAGDNDGVAYLPTFSKETQRVEEARLVQVYADEESKSDGVRPAQGPLFTLSGTILSVPQGVPVNITLVSDTGRQTVTGPNFEFQSLAPGPYELYAEAAENKRLNAPYQAAFTPVNLNGNQELRLTLLPVRESQVEVTPPPTDARSLRVLARRKDLAGVWSTQLLPVINARALLPPGRWDLSLLPPPGFYVSGFSGVRSEPNGRPDAWNEIAINSFIQVRFSLSAGPGGLHGTVKAGGDLVAGAPVYLETYDPATKRRLADLRTTRTDLSGAYRFDGLAPGVYRVLATFEFQAPDSTDLDRALARQLEAAANQDLQMDLDLYEIR